MWVTKSTGIWSSLLWTWCWKLWMGNIKVGDLNNGLGMRFWANEGKIQWEADGEFSYAIKWTKGAKSHSNILISNTSLPFVWDNNNEWFASFLSSQPKCKHISHSLYEPFHTKCYHYAEAMREQMKRSEKNGMTCCALHYHYSMDFDAWFLKTWHEWGECGLIGQRFFNVSISLIRILDTFKWIYILYTVFVVCLFILSYREWFEVLSQGLSFWMTTTYTFTCIMLSMEWISLWYRIRALIASNVFHMKKPHLSRATNYNHQAIVDNCTCSQISLVMNVILHTLKQLCDLGLCCIISRFTLIKNPHTHKKPQSWSGNFVKPNESVNRHQSTHILSQQFCDFLEAIFPLIHWWMQCFSCNNFCSNPSDVAQQLSIYLASNGNECEKRERKWCVCIEINPFTNVSIHCTAKYISVWCA